MKSTFLLITVLLIGLLPVSALDANLTAGCVSDYDPAIDYFPDKVAVEDAARFTVEYFNHYKVVTVSDAFDGAPGFAYVLAQCGAPMPDAADFPAGAQLIEVPSGALITLSTTQLPTLTQLGLLDQLVAVDSGFYISTAEVTDRIAAGQISEVGFGAEINIERVLELEPDLVMSYGFNPSSDAHPVLLEAGIFTALDTSWRELSPLGRAEWLKFTALFYNREADANALYDEIVARYDAVKELAASVSADERPTVLINTFLGYADAWFIPGADTYVGQLARDAGGDLLLAEVESTTSQALGFEVVYDGGLDADIWLTETFGVYSGADLLALDSRFGDFAAFQSGAIWNNNRDENANGGNNYYEWGLTQPHLVLADLLAIFHPDLLPDHEFAFYQQLETAESE